MSALYASQGGGSPGSCDNPTHRVDDHSNDFMALKATIFKAKLQVSDLDRHHYREYDLTLARHPSETDERMMIRLLAFALNAEDRLEFTRGLSTDDEPDLWNKNLTGEIDLWIELGLPDERRLRKASGRAKEVLVYSYGERAMGIWWQQNQEALERTPNLGVLEIAGDASSGLESLAQRSMSLNCTIQDGNCWLDDGNQTVEIQPRVLKTTRGR